MAGQSNPYTPITFSAVLPLKNGIFTVNMHTIKWGWAYLRKKISVNMPTLKSSLIKPSKSMLFFHIWNANFSVTPINSQMYMTKPKQVQKKLSDNTGKTFSVIMPSFRCRGWAYLRKLLYQSTHCVANCLSSIARRGISVGKPAEQGNSCVFLTPIKFHRWM